jgi:hypothetical protein
MLGRRFARGEMKMKEKIYKYLGMIFNSIIWFFTAFLISIFAISLVINNYYIVLPLIIGVIVFLITIFFRKRLLQLLVNNFVYSTIVYFLFMIGVFGFFMGVPVFLYYSRNNLGQVPHNNV